MTNTVPEEGGFPVALVWAGLAALIIIVIILSLIIYFKITAEPAVPEIEKIEKIPEELKEEIVPEKIPITPAKEIPEVEVKEEIEFETTIDVEESREISFKDPERASRMCSDLKLPAERDLCFFTIAKSSLKPEFCGKISSRMTKDQCYFSLAPLDIDACNKILDETARKNCKKLIALQT